jgi:hypothetical protein
VAEVVTIVTGVVPTERIHEVVDPYQAALKDGPPPAIEQTLLLRHDGGQIAILTMWRRRADLDALLSSDEEPFARRLIREAGGTPEVSMYEVVGQAKAWAGFGPRDRSHRTQDS